MSRKKSLNSQNTSGEIVDFQVVRNSEGISVPMIKIKLNDSSPLNSGTKQEEMTPVNIEDLKSVRIIKPNDLSSTSLKLTEEYAAITGSDFNRIASSEVGNFIVGPTAFTAHPESIRIGGIYRFNGLLTSTMASTMINPISTLVLDIPGLDVLKQITKTLNEFKSFLI